MEYSIKEKAKLQELLENAMYSENCDYILAQLTIIYRNIIEHNLEEDNNNNIMILDNAYIKALLQNAKDKLINENDINELSQEQMLDLFINKAISSIGDCFKDINEYVEEENINYE